MPCCWGVVGQMAGSLPPFNFTRFDNLVQVNKLSIFSTFKVSDNTLPHQCALFYYHLFQANYIELFENDICFALEGKHGLV